FGRSGLTAELVIAHLDRRKPDPERPLDVEETPAGQPLARRADRRLVDLAPKLRSERRLAAHQVVHRLIPLHRADREAAFAPWRLAGAGARRDLLGGRLLLDGKDRSLAEEIGLEMAA